MFAVGAEAAVDSGLKAAGTKRAGEGLAGGHQQVAVRVRLRSGPTAHTLPGLLLQPESLLSVRLSC